MGVLAPLERRSAAAHLHAVRGRCHAVFDLSPAGLEVWLRGELHVAALVGETGVEERA
jgi:hypothetical protein